MTITPFSISVSQDDIDDLKERLAMTRWPTVIGDGYTRGQADHVVRELADQWLNRVDWRKAEAELNRYPQLIAEVDGQRIHFAHVRSGVEGAPPLLLVHGWPSNFSEFYDLVPFLTDRTKMAGRPSTSSSLRSRDSGFPARSPRRAGTAPGLPRRSTG